MGAGVDPHLYKPPLETWQLWFPPIWWFFTALSSKANFRAGKSTRFESPLTRLFHPPAKRLLSSEEGDGIHQTRTFGLIRTFGRHAHGIAEQMGTLIPMKRNFRGASQKLKRDTERSRIGRGILGNSPLGKKTHHQP